jgi:hypothetical protein
VLRHAQAGKAGKLACERCCKKEVCVCVCVRVRARGCVCVRIACVALDDVTSRGDA